VSVLARAARLGALGAADPAVYMDNPEKAKKVVREVFHDMQQRIRLLISLPMEKLDRISLQKEARDIAAQTEPAGTSQTG